MSGAEDSGVSHITVTLRGLLPTLQPSMARVASRIIADPGAAARMSITELARSVGTSQTTVVRLCRLLGLSGYSQLRIGLAQEVGAADQSTARTVYSADIDPDDDLRAVVGKIAFADARAIEDTVQILSIDTLAAAVSALSSARRIDIFGVGASSFVALDFHLKLHRIGRVSFAWSDPHLALTSAAIAGEGDVAVAISHTGTTLDTLEPMCLAGRNGATTIAITNAPMSPIGREADLVLATAARETTFRSGAMSSRIAQLAIVDFLFVGVAQRTFGLSQEALSATAEAVRHRRQEPKRRLGSEDTI